MFGSIVLVHHAIFSFIYVFNGYYKKKKKIFHENMNGILFLGINFFFFSFHILQNWSREFSIEIQQNNNKTKEREKEREKGKYSIDYSNRQKFSERKSNKIKCKFSNAIDIDKSLKQIHCITISKPQADCSQLKKERKEKNHQIQVTKSKKQIDAPTSASRGEREKRREKAATDSEEISLQ